MVCSLPQTDSANQRYLKGRTLMKRLLTLSALMLLAGLGTALAQDVRYNFDNTANFASFKTYKWVTIKGAQQMSDLVDKQIKTAMDAELAKKGLTKTDADSADLYIGYQAAVGQEKEYTSFDTGWGYGPGYGRGWYGGGGGMTTGTTSTIYVGQLALDMYSPQPKALGWRGVASKTIDPEAEPGEQQKKRAEAGQKRAEKQTPPGE